MNRDDTREVEYNDKINEEHNEVAGNGKLSAPKVSIACLLEANEDETNGIENNGKTGYELFGELGGDRSLAGCERSMMVQEYRHYSEETTQGKTNASSSSTNCMTMDGIEQSSSLNNYIQYSHIPASISGFAESTPSQQDPNKAKLTESVKKFQSQPEYANLKSSKSFTCYPTLFEGKRLIAFDSTGSLESAPRPPKTPSNFSRVSKQDPSLDYHLYPTCLNQLRDFIFWGFYTNYSDFLLSFDNLFDHICSKISSTRIDRVYLGFIYSVYMSTLLSDRTISKFNSETVKDVNDIVNYWKDWKIPCSQYPRVPRCSRQYIEIKDYEPAVGHFNLRCWTTRGETR